MEADYVMMTWCIRNYCDAATLIKGAIHQASTGGLAISFLGGYIAQTSLGLGLDCMLTANAVAPRRRGVRLQGII